LYSLLSCNFVLALQTKISSAIAANGRYLRIEIKHPQLDGFAERKNGIIESDSSIYYENE
jgi:hypothetical protein